VEEEYLFSGEIYEIRGGLFLVQNEVGLGRKEEVYHQAFKLWLQKRGIPFLSKAPHPVRLEGETSHVLFPDFVLWDKLTLEMKALPVNLGGGHTAQLFNYLKVRNDSLGLLVNMGLEVVKVDRLIHQKFESACDADFSQWDASPPACAETIKQIFRRIHREHTTGYSKEVTDKLLHTSINLEKIPVLAHPHCQTTFQGHPLPSDTLDCLIFNHEVVVCVTALYESNLFNTHRVKSFMKHLNLPRGLAVNFGKTRLHINALTQP